MPEPTDASEVRKRIAEYLQGGGLFNPECAQHDQVRDLIVAADAVIERLTAEVGVEEVIELAKWEFTNPTSLQVSYVECVDGMPVGAWKLNVTPMFGNRTTLFAPTLPELAHKLRGHDEQ